MGDGYGGVHIWFGEGLKPTILHLKGPGNTDKAFRVAYITFMVSVVTYYSMVEMLLFVFYYQVVFRGGEGALQVLPPLVDVIPEARLNLVSDFRYLQLKL